VRKAYSSKDADFINRFPGLDWDESFEAFHSYYRHQVGIDYDTVSSISVLRVRAFTAADSLKINESLLQMGERLVNNLNNRSRQDLIAVAKQEVQVAEDRSKSAALALSGFRSQQSVFDPDRQSALQLQGVAKLQADLLATEAQLAQLQQISPNNPNIATLKGQVDNLNKTVRNEKLQVTGGSHSLSAKSASYDRFLLEKGFADRQLATALVSLESAKSEAVRKQLYLERLVQPNLPDKAMEPRRLRSVLTVLLLGLIAWGVISLLVASVKEHTE
jgi:capsular polysaccharide transport system permease protein